LNVDFLSPKAVNRCIETNFETCQEQSKTKLNGLRSFFKGLLILNLLLPYLVWKFIAQPKIKEVEFIATFRFAIALTLVPIYLLIIGLILTSVFGFKIALLYVLFVLVLDLLAVKL
jgi:cytochrome b561